jgi:uncharacterized protein
MRYEWDAKKSISNLRKHGLSFEAVEEFYWETAIVLPDERFAYGEERWLALGLIGERLHSLAFTIRDECIRIISLRVAGQKERRLWDEQN